MDTFIFRTKIFDYIHDGEELVEQSFARLIAAKQLLTYRNEGFWLAMNTLKAKQVLDDMHARGQAAWEVWKSDTSRQILNANASTALSK